MILQPTSKEHLTELLRAATTIGVLLWVAMGAVTSAIGVRPKPASATTLSLTTSSCARRREVSATPASSLSSTSTLRLPILPPVCCIHSLMAPSICLPVEACCPVIGRMTPIFSGSAWAQAAPVRVMLQL